MALTLDQLAPYSADNFGVTAGSTTAPANRYALGTGTDYNAWLQQTLAGLQNNYANSMTWQGTQPTPAGQGTFDSAFYLAQNPDVARAVQWGKFPSAYAHYNQFGAGEGRAPNSGASLLYGGRQTPSMNYGPALTGFGFNPQYYMQQNPDVARAVQAGQFANPLQHYLQFGAAEGRQSRAAPTFGQTPPAMGGMPQVAPQSWRGMTGSPFGGGYNQMATLPMMSYLQASPFAGLLGFSQGAGQNLLGSHGTFQIPNGTATSMPGAAQPVGQNAAAMLASNPERYLGEVRPGMSVMRSFQPGGGERYLTYSGDNAHPVTPGWLPEQWQTLRAGQVMHT